MFDASQPFRCLWCLGDGEGDHALDCAFRRSLPYLDPAVVALVDQAQPVDRVALLREIEGAVEVVTPDVGVVLRIIRDAPLLEE